MAGNVEEAKNESDVAPPDSEEGKLGFDNDTLRAIVEIYKGDGNESYRKRDYYNAVNFYTEGINVKCKDDELNAKLYSNRATANFYQGKYQETIDDAKAAIELQPTYVKAIERGASACEKLGQREEAIKWCDRGLAINKQNKTLLDLKKSINKPQEKSGSNFPGDVRGFPNPMSVGGFPGGAGFPGAGGAGVFPSESVTGSGETPILNDLFSDKELVAAFQDQVAMEAFQDVSQNPANVSKYGNNKNLQTIIRKLEEKFGPAGEGPPPGSNEGFPGGISFGNMFGGM